MKTIQGKPLTIALEITRDGLWIKPPRYIFHSSVSHFDFTEDEHRVTRLKQTLTRTIEVLKKTGVWKHILNKDFFKVNDLNKNMTKAQTEKVQTEYLSLRKS